MVTWFPCALKFNFVSFVSKYNFQPPHPAVFIDPKISNPESSQLASIDYTRRDNISSRSVKIIREQVLKFAFQIFWFKHLH